MSNFHEIKPQNMKNNAFEMISKDWMLITAKSGDSCNTMTASWGALGFMWGKNVAFIGIRPQRYTKEFVDASTTLSLSFFGSEYKEDLNYLGTVSGRDEDKIGKCHLTLNNHGDAPYFEEAHTVLICKKLFRQPLNPDSFIETDLLDRWYPNKDYHDLYVIEIEKVLVKDAA
ncbi:MAG TPA: flavin reductase family protein [Candidatus Merdenecus merdavium]|nr:flavin reductase family protein [Candidatus Merdenecus merdavium]